MINLESIIDSIMDAYEGNDPWAFEDKVTNTIEEENN